MSTKLLLLLLGLVLGAQAVAGSGVPTPSGGRDGNLAPLVDDTAHPPIAPSAASPVAGSPEDGATGDGDAAAASSAEGIEEASAVDAPVDEPSSLKAIGPYLKYGPWAILIIFILSGVGLHLSEDFILIPAGFLIAHGGQLPLWETLLAAYFGLVIGDLLWIMLCRRYGTRMVQSRWFKRIVHPRRLLEVKHQMELRGIMVVVLARFVPGTRTPSITMAGILHLSWWKLVLVECCSCAVTVPLQVGIGYLAGMGMGESKSTGELVIKIVAATAAVALIGVLFHWWLQRRKTVGRAPRSKAAWLRTFGRRRRETEMPTTAG
jgi:membrane protein DedA with SNARE-associated domain